MLCLQSMTTDRDRNHHRKSGTCNWFKQVPDSKNLCQLEGNFLNSRKRARWHDEFFYCLLSAKQQKTSDMNVEKHQPASILNIIISWVYDGDGPCASSFEDLGREEGHQSSHDFGEDGEDDEISETLDVDQLVSSELPTETATGCFCYALTCNLPDPESSTLENAILFQELFEDWSFLPPEDNINEMDHTSPAIAADFSSSPVQLNLLEGEQGSVEPEWIEVATPLTHGEADGLQGVRRVEHKKIACTHAIPENFHEPVPQLLFGELVELDMKQNGLKKLPDLSIVPTLERLIVWENELSDLSGKLVLEGKPVLPNLTSLDLRDNKIVRLQSELSILKGLIRLNLNSNKLEEFPSCILEMVKLRSLMIMNNWNIRHLPQGIVALKDLIELGLKRCNLGDSLLSITDWMPKDLDMIILEGIGMTSIPDYLADWPRLETLRISQNSLSCIDKLKAVSFQRIKVFTVEGNRLVRLPDSICCLQNKMVTVLNLDHNCLRTLPNTIREMSELRSISVQFNCLDAVPPSFCQLTKLQHIKLRNNQLSSIANLTLSLFVHLQLLDLRCNPIERRWLQTTLEGKFHGLSRLQRVVDMDGTLVDSLSGIFPHGLSRFERVQLIERPDSREVEVTLGNLTVQFGSLSITSLTDSVANLGHDSAHLSLNTRELVLAGRRLTVVPDEAKDLRHLRVLILRNNYICSFPKWVGLLEFLEIVDATENCLLSFPNALTKLQRLQEIYLMDNLRMKGLPCCCNSWCQGCDAGALPTDDNAFRLPTSVRVLDLSGCSLTKLPASFAHNHLLTELRLGRNKFLSVLVKPRDGGQPYCPLANLSNLQTLALRGCSVGFHGVLPTGIGHCCALLRLDLFKMELARLPDSMAKLSNLQELNISDNRLMELPHGMGSMRSLMRLEANQNQLTQLPKRIGNLPALTEINLENNQLTALPESMMNLKSLKTMWLHRNAPYSSVGKHELLMLIVRLSFASLREVTMDKHSAYLPDFIPSVQQIIREVHKLHASCAQTSTEDAELTGQFTNLVTLH